MAKTYKADKKKEIKKKLDKELDGMPAFMHDYAMAKSVSKEESTLYAYVIDMRVFLNFLKSYNPLYAEIEISRMGLDVLKNAAPRDILEYISYLKNYERGARERANSLSGIKRKLSSLSAVYTYFCKAGDLAANPVLAVDMPKITHGRVTILHDNEIERIFDAVETGSALSEISRERFHEKLKHRDRAIITLLLSSGIRVSELVGMNVRDIDFDHPAEDSSGNVIYEAYVLRKGGDEDKIYLTENTIKDIRIYMETNRKALMKGKTDDDEPALFISNRGKRISVGNVEALVKKYSLTAVPAKRVHPHVFRKTRGTKVYSATNDLKLTAAVLGDKSVEVVNRHYVAGNEQDRKDAANI